LGLWVTYQLIAKYGGSVQVYSSARSGPNGTVFRICFADSNRVVQAAEQNGSVKMERHSQERSGGRWDDKESDQTLKRA